MKIPDSRRKLQAVLDQVAGSSARMEVPGGQLGSLQWRLLRLGIILLTGQEPLFREVFLLYLVGGE